MFELWIPALIASAAAGLWDLKTTEVPDEIPVVMSAVGLFYWCVASLQAESIYPFAVSLASGMAFLAPGLILYKAGKWGAADAWVPASVMFLLPIYGGKMMLADYAFNFFVVSSAYMIVYSIILGAMNRHVFPLFVKDFVASRSALMMILGYAVIVAILAYLFVQKGASLAPLGYSFASVAFLVAFWRYATVVEANVFRKTIDAARVREGDVLEDMIWIGLTKAQAEDVRKKGGKVVIKEGVRFVPVFSLTLAATLLYGNLVFYLFL